MADPTAQASIRALQAQGLSYSAIGRLVGRNDSLIRQVALGRKPGSNLAAPLARATRGEPVGTVARRTTAAGTPAKTRAGAVKLADGGEMHKYRTAGAARRELERAAAQGKRVTIYATAKSKTRTVARGSRAGQPLKVRVQIGERARASDILARMQGKGAGAGFAQAASDDDGSAGDDDYYADVSDFDIVEYDEGEEEGAA